MQRVGPWRRVSWAIRLTGLVVFPLLIWLGVDIREAGETLRASNLGLVILGLTLMLAAVLLRTWRWKLVAEASGIHYPRFWDYLVLFYTGLFAGAAMPQAAASFSPVLFISEDGRSWRRAALSIAIDRLVDLAVLLAFAFAAALYLFPVFPEVSLAVIGFLAGLGASGLLAFLFLPRLRRALGENQRRWRSLSSLLTLSESPELGEVFRAVRGRLTAVVALSLIILSLQISMVIILAQALSLGVPLLFLAMAWSLVALAVALPISIVGLGPREGVLVLMFNAVGEPKEGALALGLLLFVVGILVRLPGALAWLRRSQATAPRSVALPTRLSATSSTEDGVVAIDQS